MKVTRRKNRSTSGNIAKLPPLLDQIDPDVYYGDWLRVLMAIFYETGGSEAGFNLADAWSSKGQKYRNSREIRYKWDNFTLDLDKPVTIGTLIWMAKRGS